MKCKDTFPLWYRSPEDRKLSRRLLGSGMMCYLLHPERAEDIHIVTGPTNKPGRIGVVVRKELDSAPRNFHPKGLCFCGSPVRATRILNGLSPFLAGPQYTYTCVTWPTEGTIRGCSLGCCLGSIDKDAHSLGSVSAGNPYALLTQLKSALPRASWAIEAALPVFPGLWGPPTMERDKVGQNLLPGWRRQGTRGGVPTGL